MKKHFLLTLALSLLMFVPLTAENTASIIIRGGQVYDGSMNKPVKVDIMISNDKIVFIGDCSGKSADKIIDATGYVVAPGFIDPHSHSNRALIKKETNSNENMLQQGVTTVLCGVCGSSPLPLSETFAKMEKQGIGTNCGFFAGQGSIRTKVLGKDHNRKVTSEEMAKMQQILSDAMDEGAFGMSTGLYYSPGSFSTTEEVIELSKAMSAKEGIYTSHIRSEGSNAPGLDSSIREAIRIGKEAGVQVNISHIKASVGFWGKAQQIIDLIEQAQKDGLYITADQYPYVAANTSLSASMLPRWAELGGRKDMLRRLENPDTLALIKEAVKANISSRNGAKSVLISKDNGSKFEGKTLKEIAKMLSVSEVDAVVEMLKLGTPSVNTFVINEKDMRRFMAKPWVMTGTDGSFGSHPRATGTYPLKLQEYVFKHKIISFQDMIYRSSGKVAETYGIEKRGFIREGYFADVIVFKPEEFKANSTYMQSDLMATGMKYVIINGKIAVQDSKYNGVLAGVPVRKHNASKDPAILASHIQRAMKEHGAIGVAVAVVKDNKVIYQGAFGKRDLEGKSVFGEKDIFRIASISKSFCATSIMQLVEAGKLSLDQEVGDILGFKIRNPHFPNDKITLDMLLSHTSSINDSQTYKTIDRINPATNKNSDKCYSDYRPGSGYRYCNLNFNLLGAVVEKISGERYDKYVKKHIIDPLGLNASLNVNDLDSNLFVPLYSYDKKAAQFKHNPQAYYPVAKSFDDYVIGYDAALFSPTGGMKISAVDLARYMIMHMNYGTSNGVKIISESSSRLMQSRHTTTDVVNTFYGFALRSMDGSWVPEVKLKGHTGSAYGLSSTMTFNPKEKYGFTTICNGYSGTRPLEAFDNVLYYHFIY